MKIIGGGINSEISLSCMHVIKYFEWMILQLSLQILFVYFILLFCSSFFRLILAMSWQLRVKVNLNVKINDKVVCIFSTKKEDLMLFIRIVIILKRPWYTRCLIQLAEKVLLGCSYRLVFNKDDNKYCAGLESSNSVPIFNS